MTNISIYQALRGSTGGGGGGSLSPVVSAKTVTVNEENIKAVMRFTLTLLTRISWPTLMIQRLQLLRHLPVIIDLFNYEHLTGVGHVHSNFLHEKILLRLNSDSVCVES